MLNKKILCQALAVAGLVATTGAANATISVFTSLSSFMDAISGAALAPGVDTFDGFSVSSTTISPIRRNAGDFSYTALAEPGGGFFGAGTFSNPALSTLVSFDPMLFNNFTSGVNAIGGNFYTSDLSGGSNGFDMRVTATDSTGAVIERIITGTNTSSFIGFVSTDGMMMSLQAIAVQPLGAGFVWPTLDNLMLANTAPIPEPGTYALMLAGLAGIGSLVARARRKA